MIVQELSLECADEILSRIEKVAQRKFLPIIGARKGEILASEVRRSKPKHVLEVGTLIGYSAILMSKELSSDAELVTIEIHRSEATAAGQNIVEAQIPAKVTVITGNALEVIPTLGGKFDFAFIDAEKREYLKYLKLAEPKFCRGTVVVADNAGIFAEEMADYLDYVRASGRYRSRYVQVGGDGVEISVRL